MLTSRPLFELKLRVPALVDLGDTPYGGRRVAAVVGGTFEGDRLRGEVLPQAGSDWLLQRADGVLMLDVRLMLRTDDGALIGMAYRGMRHGPPDLAERLARGENVDPSTYYFRALPMFETSSAPYAWLNRIVAVGVGRRVPEGPVYDVHEVL